MSRENFEADFAVFLSSRARPALDEAVAGRRAALRRAIMVGLAVSVLAGLVVWDRIFHGLALVSDRSFPPFIFVAFSGCSFGVIAGVMAYVVFLKRLLERLRLSLVGGLDRLIHSDARQESALPADGFRPAEIFPEELAGASSGGEVFRLSMGKLEISLAEIIPAARTDKADGGEAPGMRGVFLQAAPASGAEVDASGFMPELPSDVQKLDGRRLLWRWNGRVLALALICPAAPGSPRGRLAELGLDGYRDFAWEARLCLEALSLFAEYVWGGYKTVI